MNHDEKNPDKKKQISAEMEARMIAWVAGGASDEESAELALLTSGDPGLAALKARIEAAQKLVSEAVHPDREPLRLSGERRAALLKALGTADKADADASVLPSLEATRRKQRNERRWLLAVAACLTAGLFLSLAIHPSSEYTTSSRSSQAGKMILADKVAENDAKAVEGRKSQKDEQVQVQLFDVSLPTAPDQVELNPKPAPSASADEIANVEAKPVQDSASVNPSLKADTERFLQDAGANNTKDLLKFGPNGSLAASSEGKSAANEAMGETKASGGVYAPSNFSANEVGAGTSGDSVKKLVANDFDPGHAVQGSMAGNAGSNSLATTVAPT